MRVLNLCFRLGLPHISITAARRGVLRCALAYGVFQRSIDQRTSAHNFAGMSTISCGGERLPRAPEADIRNRRPLRILRSGSDIVSAYRVGCACVDSVHRAWTIFGCTSCIVARKCCFGRACLCSLSLPACLARSMELVPVVLAQFVSSSVLDSVPCSYVISITSLC